MRLRHEGLAGLAAREGATAGAAEADRQPTPKPPLSLLLSSVVIASYQMAEKLAAKLFALRLRPFRTVIADESHLLKARCC